jgi:hypothetical protein
VRIRSGARPPDERSLTERRADDGVQVNVRLTASNAAALLVLPAAEGVTTLRFRQLVSPHVFVGKLLIPPVLVTV